MWLTATEIFLGTSIIFLAPIQIKTNSGQIVSLAYFIEKKPKPVATNFSGCSNCAYKLASQASIFTDRPASVNTLSTITLNTSEQNNNSNSPDPFLERSLPFKSGVASWKTDTTVGSVRFDGNFDPRAHLNRGKAIWRTDTDLGSVDLTINLNDRIKPIKTIASWQADTAMGSLTVEGDFSDRLAFTSANAAWNAKTSLGTVAVRGNFNEQTNFTGGNLRVATKTPVGSIDANLQVDEETQFRSARASWNADLFFGSSIGVDGKFDETTAFDGGSIKLGAKTSLGNLGIQANVDRETHLTSGSAFWKTKAGSGSINLNVDVEKDGDFESKLGIEFPF